MAVLAACTTPATETSESLPLATTRSGAVVVSLSMERASTLPGEPIELELRVANEGLEGVVWRSAGCNLEAAITLRPRFALRSPIEPPLVGPMAAIDAALAQAEVLAPLQTLAFDRRGQHASCTLDHGFSLLEAGDRLTLRSVWPARFVTGAHATTGAYAVSAAFPIIGEDVPLAPAEFQEVRDLRPVTVELPLEVTAAATGFRSATQAVAQMLADPHVAGWLDGHASADATARLSLVDGRWTLRVLTADGQGLATELGATGFDRPRVRIGPPIVP